MNVWYRLFLEHPYSTNNPQLYWKHVTFSIVNSGSGIKYMLAGFIHGIFPCLFPFSTSSWVIRSFIKVVASKRHSKELQQYLSIKFLDELKKEIKK
jgi:hypothetical protein|tara:strand:- start:74 stop:361 length:288 start_codon:yes stop_codon:yes gene_type:complete